MEEFDKAAAQFEKEQSSSQTSSSSKSSTTEKGNVIDVEVEKNDT